MKKMILAFVSGIFVIGANLCPVLAESENTVNVGAIFPLTGGVAVVGKDMLDGIKVGVAEVNARGGLSIGDKKYKVILVSYDDECKPDKTLAGARKLVSLDKVHAIVGPTISSCALALLGINEKLGLLMSCMAVHPEIVEKGNSLVVRPNPTLSMMSKSLANTVIDKTPYRKLAVIYHTDDWGMGWKKEFGDVIKSRGAKIITEEGIDEKTQSDFYAQLTKIIAAKPDAIFIVAHDRACSLMVKQARELGYKGGLIFSEGFRKKGREAIGYENLEGCIWAALPYDFETPAVLKFMEKYKKYLKKDPILNYSPIGYECFMLLAYGMEKAGSVDDPQKIRAAIPKVIPFPESIWQSYDMGTNGQAKSKVFVGIVTDGKPQLLK